MAYYVYNNTTKDLVATSDFAIDCPEDCTLTMTNENLTKSQLDSLYQWNKEKLEFVPKPQNILTKREFLKRLTAQEYSSIKSAAQQNHTIDYYWQLFMVAEIVDLNDPDTRNGINFLEQIGILAPGRAAEILS